MGHIHDSRFPGGQVFFRLVATLPEENNGTGRKRLKNTIGYAVRPAAWPVASLFSARQK